SGQVFTVKGAASALACGTSGAAGFFVPVLPHSRRCGRAPKLWSRLERCELRRALAAAYVRLAMAIPSWSRRFAGTLSATATSHRLTKTDATAATFGLSPAETRRAIPRKYASAAARYCSRETRRARVIGTRE